MSFGLVSSYVALWIWAVFQGLLAVAVLRQVTELEKKAEKIPSRGSGGLPVGSRAPKFLSNDLLSGQVIDDGIFDPLGGVILFLASNCPVCRRLAKSFRPTTADALPPVVAFCSGQERGCARLRQLLGPQITLVLRGAIDFASLYGVTNFPTAVVVDRERRIFAYGSPRTAEDLKQLVSESLGGHMGVHAGEELATLGANSRQGA